MNAAPEIDLRDLLRATHVKRWHVVNTVRGQTLADHNYTVAVIALSLYNDIIGGDAVADLGEIALLLAAALFHDAVEVRTGDVPTPGKRLIKQFGGADIFDTVEESVMPGIPLIRPCIKCSDVLTSIIKLADTIEAAIWIRENGVGEIARQVAAKCWESMEAQTKYIKDGEWAFAVNRVLLAASCPPLRSNVL